MFHCMSEFRVPDSQRLMARMVMATELSSESVKSSVTSSVGIIELCFQTPSALPMHPLSPALCKDFHWYPGYQV
jgi:hypothetical protein